MDEVVAVVDRLGPSFSASVACLDAIRSAKRFLLERVALSILNRPTPTAVRSLSEVGELRKPVHRRTSCAVIIVNKEWRHGNRFVSLVSLIACCRRAQNEDLITELGAIFAPDTVRFPQSRHGEQYRSEKTHGSQ